MAENEKLKPGWTKVKFGEVVRLCKDRSSDPEADGIERYVGLEHLEPEDLRIRRWGLVADGTTFTSRFKPGQVLFGKRRAYQRKVAVADFEGVCSGDIYVFESADPKHLLPELLPFICRTDQFFEYAVGTSAGSLSPRTNWNNLHDYELALPSLEEQEGILGVLSNARILNENIHDLLLNQRTVKLSLIEERAKSLCRLGTTKLKTVVKNIEAGKSPISSGKVAAPGEYGVLKVSAVGDWGYYSSENKLISGQDYLPDLEVKSGDLLATRANADPNSVGRTCIVDTSPSNLMLSDKTWRIHLKNDAIVLGVLAWTKSSIFRKHILKTLGGTEAKNISQTRFLDGPFPICDEADLEDFSIEIKSLLSSEASLKKRYDEIGKLLKLLINQTMAA
jgi:type I restriction enzyme S subunit